MNKTEQKIIDTLQLKPHPEGGWFKETYRADEQVEAAALPDRYSGPRCHSTAIYFLITADNFSALHRITSDEIFHFYAGDPAEMLQIDEDGAGTKVIVGSDVAAGQNPQVRVPANHWQALRLVDGGSFALFGCTVAPGFDFSDFEMGDRTSLLTEFPVLADSIRSFTR